MIIYPSIDVYKGNIVRLRRGNYNEIVYFSDDVPYTAMAFRDSHATHMHIVDLEGAKTGETPNIETIAKAIKDSGLFTEVGGGIRSEEVVKKYLDCGASRVILGTAAFMNPDFLNDMVAKYSDKIAVGVDIMDGCIRVNGWLEKASETVDAAFERLISIGVKTVICTDISKDGMLSGANTDMYRELVSKYPSIDMIASGGVTTMEDLRAIRDIGMSGAILGRALYAHKISLWEALMV